MFRTLCAFSERPEPFSVYSADTLWTDPHIARQMLAYHLDPETSLSSRTPDVIDATVQWIDTRTGLDGKAVCDLGCGPGLYTSRMARLGARVEGLDFSPVSITHASHAAAKDGLPITYRRADYLKDDLPPEQDVFIQIYGDMGVLSPEKRAELLIKIKTALNPGGYLIFDLFPAAQFRNRTEDMEWSHLLMGGFWAEGDYHGFRRTFLYDDLKLVLDRYLIVEANRTREIFNWLQYFDPGDIKPELEAAGFAVEDIVDALTGESWTDPEREFAVIARS